MSQILHITDLHIKDPDGSEEYLRRLFFDEYLDSLVGSITPLLNNGGLDCLVVTGDFIDKGNVDNFDHAGTVIQYLAKELKLPLDKVVVCNGNHDILREFEASGDYVAARKPFKRFASQFGNGKPVKESDRALLSKPAENLWCLMIDATLGSKGEDRPGNLLPREVDEIMDWIKHLPSEDLLIIGAHYPVHNIMAEGAVFDEDDPLWSKRHMWGQGEVLKERLRVRKPRPRIIWLCGDIHKSFNVSHDGQRFMATGRLGTQAKLADSQVRRHARFINADPANTTPDVRLLEFVPIGHRSQPHLGRWAMASEEETIAQTGALPGEHSFGPQDALVVNSQPALTSEVPAPPIPDRSSFKTNELGSVDTIATGGRSDSVSNNGLGVELIDPDLQEELLNTIRDSRLYHFGRFDTSDVEVSLAWISMGLLLNKEGILPSILNAMSEWLKVRLGLEESEAPDKSLLIGMDCWGSVIASQLSVLLSVPNICVGERGGGQHYLPSETFTSSCYSEIEKAETIVLVSDVVATGRSLVSLHEKVCVGDSTAANKRWLALSIICDEKQKRVADCSFFEAHGTACKDLRMPFLPSDQLPPESILAPLISFK